jgi:hypothetical protein
MGELQAVVPSLEALAAEVGARDLFVLRRVEEGRYAHLGGAGRGDGWAGVVELRAADDPEGARAIAGDEVVRLRGNRPVRVFGPYWSTQAAFVPLDHDRLVVLGGLDGDAPAEDAVLLAVAQRAVQAVGEVSPAKRLADELEVVHAVKEVLAVEAATLQGTMAAVVER